MRPDDPSVMERTEIETAERPSSFARRAELLPGQLVDHFRIIRFLDRGGMGDVYLARDTKLGRKVALKLIHARHLAKPEIRERFLFEARATAQFSHPNIVALYHVGELGDRPYLALEYLEGRSLRQRIREERPPLKEALRIALAIAEALAEAHRHNIAHRDLKPANIFMASDGRLRLLDFGLAMPIGPSDLSASEDPRITQMLSPAARLDTGRYEGTPVYMAPEQWMGEALATTDVWALGAILFELVSGKPPFFEPTVAGQAAKVCGTDLAPQLVGDHLPEGLADLVSRCLNKDPEGRPAAAEVARTLDGIIHKRRRWQASEPTPFPGLFPFSERQSELFFGRDAELDAFLERARHVPILPIVGPSGAGKSSFVEAGVIPRLKEQDRWTILSLRPGKRPFFFLAAQIAAIRGDRPGADGLAHDLTNTPGLLALELADLAEQNGGRVLLFVDQLEEVYTLVEDTRLRRSFMNAICTAADDPRDPVRVVFTLRDDFLGRVAETAEVRKALSQVTVMQSPGADGLREILLRPLELAEYAYEDPGIVEDMIESVRGEPACLPLLQFTATMLWERRDMLAQRIRRSSYEALGGVVGALTAHADGILQGLTPSELRVARSILLRLVTPERTRRVAHARQVISGLSDEAGAVLERLIQARLVTARKPIDAGDGEAEVELVHESLARNWLRLSRWIDESREEHAFISELGQVAELWRKRGSKEEELWSGGELEEALRRRDRLPPTDVPEIAHQFLAASTARRDRLTRSKRRLRAVAGAGAFSLAILGFALAWAFNIKGKEAEHGRKIAEEQRAVAGLRWADAQREAARAALLSEDLVEVRARIRGALEIADSPVARSLWRTMESTPLVWKKTLGGAAQELAFSPDGTRVAVTAQDRTIYLFDATTLETRFLRGHGDQAMGLAFSPNGAQLASSTWSGEIALWDLESGRMRKIAELGQKVAALAFSPDGRVLVSGGWDHVVRLWDIASGKEIRSLAGHSGRVYGVRFSPDGSRVASASNDESVKIWDLGGGIAAGTLRGHKGAIFDLAFSPNGSEIATAGADGTVRVFDARRFVERRQIRAHAGGARRVAFLKDGARIISAGGDGTIAVFDASQGHEVARLSAHTDRIEALAIDREHDRVVSGALDRTVRMFDLSRLSEASDESGHSDRVVAAAFSPDGKTVATGGWDKSVRLWSADRGRERSVLRDHRAPVFGVAFSPDGSQLATASWDKTIRVYDLKKNSDPRVLYGHTADVSAVVFSPDGTKLASSSWDKTARVWDASTGAELARYENEGPVYDLTFSESGKTLVTATAEGDISFFDLPSKKSTKKLRGHDGAVYGVAFSGPKELVSGGKDGTVRVWNLSTGASRVVAKLNGRVFHLDVDAKTRRAGVPCSDGIARVIDLDRDRVVELRGHRAGVNYLRFSKDGRLAVTTGDDGTVRLWHTIDGLPVWRATAFVPKSAELFTHNGWTQLGAGKPGPHTAWKKTIEDQGRRVAFSLDGRRVAIATYDRSVSVWDLAGDKEIVRKKDLEAQDVVALSDGVAVLHDLRVSLLRDSGELIELVPVARAIAAAGGDRLVAVSPHGAQIFSHSGKAEQEIETDLGVTAAALFGDELLLGFEDGNVERASLGSSGEPEPIALKEIPSSAVLEIAKGPSGSVALGYANGLAGLWDAGEGSRLASATLHGPIQHLHFDEGRLYAASELGDSTRLDLGIFGSPYCDLLQRVWSSTPYVWQNGHALVAAVPADHPCRAR
jgi:WD40 repeat protein/serine/threonine protein kinase